MLLTKDRPDVPALEDELELLKDQLAERILHKADPSEVSEIEASIRKMWANLGDGADWFEE